MYCNCRSGLHRRLREKVDLRVRMDIVVARWRKTET